MFLSHLLLMGFPFSSFRSSVYFSGSTYSAASVAVAILLCVINPGESRCRLPGKHPHNPEALECNQLMLFRALVHFSLNQSGSAQFKLRSGADAGHEETR